MLKLRADEDRTQFKGDHLRIFLVPIAQAVSEETIFKTIGSYVKTKSADVGCLGWRVRSLDTILKGDHLRTIPSKFGPNSPSSFRGDDF